MPHLFRPRMLRTNSSPLSEASRQVIADFDAILADPVAAKVRGYAPLRKMLMRIPRAERGLAYTERHVILYSLFRMKNGRAGSLSAQLKSYYKHEGKLAEIKDFTDRLQVALGDTGLTNHGYRDLFSELDTDLLVKDLAEVFVRLDKLGFPAFINSGTLLGAVREGTFIGHDDDVDLAVILPAKTQHEIFGLIRAFYLKLEESGITGLKPFFSSTTLIIKIDTPNGLQIDIFPAWIEQSKAYVWPHTYGELTQDDILPLSTASLNGRAFPAPAAPEKMLMVNYGPDWRTPDSGFIFQWKEARRKFAPVLRKYQSARRIHRLKQVLGLAK